MRPTSCLQQISATITLCIFSATASAETYSCGEWSEASLLHRGVISVELRENTLTWSNDRQTYGAELINSAVGHNVYSDDASIYMVYGLPPMDEGNVFDGRRLTIRRIFFSSMALQVSELMC
ncbi:hypothetical protein ACFFUT_12880 [Pseudohalocynthiibacter aestuariivivens]|jgi:hypothetical protein|uniref:Uncharacterized protein n=1 Tax=Pseudohalocynthiibacter aestuariivivens TaxID=1591409 RepID=A0ABV5JJ05_9RHOB|nr:MULTISPECIES: hypothetical protein [Pseudohalocynthiibacter]MBS9718164.1 hypothetical protein [Pseudohalocynthiibacter aestuariivivens]MCK0103814.1 hypothetical protein [Pseudohalocynthiibacter sp. F2068]